LEFLVILKRNHLATPIQRLEKTQMKQVGLAGKAFSVGAAEE
jgi:hypothetical protein